MTTLTTFVNVTTPATTTTTTTTTTTKHYVTTQNGSRDAMGTMATLNGIRKISTG
jgi:hypothetical protein